MTLFTGRKQEKYCGRLSEEAGRNQIVTQTIKILLTREEAESGNVLEKVLWTNNNLITVCILSSVCPSKTFFFKAWDFSLSQEI